MSAPAGGASIVRGYLQTYDWGAVDGLAQWVGATGGPQAELWFGTHPNGPSPGRDGAAVSLRTPILTKVLAAGRPLSIQIHPPADLARAQYEAQQADPAVPSLLPDPYAKAEILIALEPFEILEGFRDPRRSAEVFALLGAPLVPATEALRSADLPTAIRSLLGLHTDDVLAHAGALPGVFATTGIGDPGIMEQVLQAFPGDPGVFVAALLDSRTLAPGQAVYVDPGTVHAYVRGTGVEVMTASDNVLRLGLTSKTVAVGAALEALSVDGRARFYDPQPVDGVTTYAPADAPFSVQMLTDTEVTAATGSPRTILCLRGTVHSDDDELRAGDAMLVEAGAPDVNLSVDGQAAIAQGAR
ncbi:MAG: mannose-6-phosphate isomerase, class I [Candidatus Nanopelagicales bacterium]